MSREAIHILLIADNPGDVRLVQEFMTEAGLIHFMTHVDRLSTGLERLAEGGLDVVLLDLWLSDSHGLETLTRLHTQAPSVPIVVLTDQEDEALGVMLVQAGAQDYLVQGQLTSHLLMRSVSYAIERKRTEEALRQSEERFRQVVLSISDHIYMTEITAEGHFVNRYLSPHVETLTGYPHEKFVTDWRFWSAVIHPDDRIAAANQAAQLVEGHSNELEYRLVQANGDIIWVRDSARVQPKSTSNLVYGVVSDITARKRAEEELRKYKEYLEELVAERTFEVTEANQQLEQEIIERQQAEEELRFQKTLLECQSEAMIDGILVISSARKLLFFNQHFIEMWGISEEIITSRSSQAALQSVMDQLVDPQQFLAKVEYVYEHPDDMTHDELTLKDSRIFDCYSAPIKSVEGVHYGRVWYYRDHTERKRMEVALQESEALFRATFEEAPIGISLADLQGDVFAGNLAFQKMLGYDAEELRNLASGVEFIHPDDANEGARLFQELVRGERPGYQIEKRYIRKEGQVVWGRLTASLVRDDQSRPLFVVGMIEDITERKQAETRQVQLLQELKSVNRELNDFAYVVSHDLKAPLRAIGSLVNWIAADNADQLGAEGQEQLDLLLHRVKRMHALIEGILEYSRLGRSREERAEVDLNKLMAEVIDTLAPPPSIELKIENDLPIVVGEKTRLQQLFQNLVSNAIKFMDKPQGEIRVGYIGKGDEWQFYVADNGPGIEAKHFVKIFQLFQTLVPRDEFESTGVGLTLVEKIVELHGGKIWLESNIGEGSTFFFTLPKEVKNEKYQAYSFD